MIRDHVKCYMKEQNNNCAEALLHAADDELGLHLPPESFRLIAGYGGGMGCEKTCGAICSALAVLSFLSVGRCAHETEGFRALCGGCVQRMEQAFGSIDCASIKVRYRDPETGCLGVVERAADVLEDVLVKEGKLPIFQKS